MTIHDEFRLPHMVALIFQQRMHIMVQFHIPSDSNDITLLSGVTGMVTRTFTAWAICLITISTAAFCQNLDSAPCDPAKDPVIDLFMYNI